jgi:hypothetical protein
MPRALRKQAKQPSLTCVKLMNTAASMCPTPFSGPVRRSAPRHIHHPKRTNNYSSCVGPAVVPAKLPPNCVTLAEATSP